MNYGSISEQASSTSIEDPQMSQEEQQSYTKLLRRNVKGWYFYSFSSEPFIVSAVSTYIPLLLEQYARVNGVQLKNHRKACKPTDDKCVLPLFNGIIFVDTSSFPLYTFSLSVLVQTFIVITVSGIVDKWNSVKLKGHILVLFSIIGSISTLLISQLNVTQIYSLPLLYIIANSCFGVINVVGNSLLPTFVTGLTHLPQGSVDDDGITLSQEKLINMISGRGASLGYLSALLVQIISMILVDRSKSKQDIQVAIAFVGVWWMIWQTPMWWLFQDIPFLQTRTPPVNESNNSPYNNRIPRKHFNLKLLSYGWLSLWESLKHARLLKDVMIFLLSWFIISDSTTTINSTAILFSKTELNMSTLNLITISILTMINAMIGAFVIPQFLSKKLNLLPKRILIFIILWTCIIPFYGILGFFFTNIGLKHKFEMFILAIWYGLSLGGLAAVSRSVFGLIIPRGKESTFFSLFSITDKGSSILGPFLIGLITDKTHNIRYAFYLLFILLLLSLPFLEMLDVDRGKKEAEELSYMNPLNSEPRLD